MNNADFLTEEKLDYNVIPATKRWGIVSAIVTGLLQVFCGNLIYGVILAIIGVMSTLGLCIILEGFSTIIKLLRAISLKEDSLKSQVSADDSSEKIRLLKQLKELLDNGIINNNEYEIEKAKLLK